MENGKLITACAFLFLFCLASASVVSMPVESDDHFEKVTEDDLRLLASVMSGDFSSEKQHLADSYFFHIKLRMRPIWSGDADAFWFYVEQSAADAQDRPYRQRVYRLYLEDEKTIISKVFEIDKPERFAGGWADVNKLKDLTKVALKERTGCAISLKKKKDGIYAGSTPGKECLSSLRGAAYATSEVTIFKDRLVSWDRGWDADDNQVWGSTKGGYIFDKIGSFD